MGFTDLVTPEATSHWHDGQLSQDDGAADGSCHLLAALDAESDVTVVVSDGHKSLEPGALTGTGLLLHGHDLQYLVLHQINDYIQSRAMLCRNYPLFIKLELFNRLI